MKRLSALLLTVALALLAVPAAAPAAYASRRCLPPAGTPVGVDSVRIAATYPAGYITPATLCSSFARPTIRAFLRQFNGPRIRYVNGWRCVETQIGYELVAVTCRTSWVRTGIGRTTMVLRFHWGA